MNEVLLNIGFGLGIINVVIGMAWLMIDPCVEAWLLTMAALVLAIGCGTVLS